MRIDRIEIQDMWSFGAPAVVIDGLAQHNVLIGKNNAGKSKVLASLRWVKDHAQQLATDQILDLDPAVRRDTGETTAERTPRLSITLAPADIDFTHGTNTLRAMTQGVLTDVVPFALPIPVVEIGAVSAEGDKVKPSWRVVEALPPRVELKPDVAERCGPEKAAAILKSRAKDFSDILARWYSAVRDSRPALLDAFANSTRYVGGWRTLRSAMDGGKSIIQNLHMWFAPSQPEKALHLSFRRVQRLFRMLMLDNEVAIIPEHNASSLNLQSEGRYVPIDSCGDGVQHLLMLAYHLAVAPDCILLIEEPETHLHPELQRNLMRVLAREFKGQSIITTHSPVLLDSALPSKIYRVEHDRSCSTVTTCTTTQDLYHVLDDLDVRASDILQANIVIWVEGPTDRLFLKRCFELRGDDLTEGLQYQFAYYGGRLRSHFTFDGDPHLCNLLRMSRHVAMICDSDLADEAGQVDASKKRLEKECLAAGGWYWITDGREIENYFPDELLTTAYRDAELLGDQTVEIRLPRHKKLGEVLCEQFPCPGHGDTWKVRYDENKVRLMPLYLRHMTPEHHRWWGLDTRLRGCFRTGVHSASAA